MSVCFINSIHLLRLYSIHDEQNINTKHWQTYDKGKQKYMEKNS